MKKLFLAVSILCVCLAHGAEAVLKAEGKNPPSQCLKTYTPLSINIITPVGLPWGFDWDVKGLQIGGWNWIEDSTEFKSVLSILPTVSADCRSAA